MRFPKGTDLGTPVVPCEGGGAMLGGALLVSFLKVLTPNIFVLSFLLLFYGSFTQNLFA